MIGKNIVVFYAYIIKIIKIVKNFVKKETLRIDIKRILEYKYLYKVIKCYIKYAKGKAH